MCWWRRSGAMIEGGTVVIKGVVGRCRLSMMEKEVP